MVPALLPLNVSGTSYIPDFELHKLDNYTEPYAITASAENVSLSQISMSATISFVILKLNSYPAQLGFLPPL